MNNDSGAAAALPSDEARPVRKPYRPPKLTLYGTVRELTREGGPNRDKDGGNNAAGNRT